MTALGVLPGLAILGVRRAVFARFGGAGLPALSLIDAWRGPAVLRIGDRNGAIIECARLAGRAAVLVI